MYGKDFAYANSRIQGTVVRLKKDNEPVYVQLVNNMGLCSVVAIEGMDQHMEAAPGTSMTIRLDDLNLEPVPLGYVNTGGRALYLQRIPIRRGPGNQGLTQGNCGSTGERLWRFPNKSLRQCIIGKYPSFDKAVEEAKVKTRNGNGKLIAFHRHWAVGPDTLYYKNELLVGTIVKGKPVLDEKFNYLKESLTELV